MSASRKPLRWVKREISPVNRSRLRAFENAGSMMDSALPRTVHELPDLSAYPTPRAKAIRLLQTAAAVEHALMVQYLYAGYSLPNAGNVITGISVEEMSHFMTVQNLLASIGEPPDLDRQDFGVPGSDEERLFPFDLYLEPVSNVSLAKYVLAESPETVSPTVPAALMDRIISLATSGHTVVVNRVATLYGLLGAVFGSESYLLGQAATGDLWYIAVNALAAEAAVAYGGRDQLHLEDADFEQASVPNQATDAEWDRSRELPTGADEFRVHVAGTRETALAALRDIGLQGEGPSPVSGTDSHFERFLALFTQLFGPDGLSTTPPAGVRQVPRAARIEVNTTSVDPEAIREPVSVRWATLADHRYGILLGALELYLKSPATDRAFLLGWCFAEMFAIRNLATILTTLPRNATPGSTACAAVPFNRPSWIGRAVTWNDLRDVLAGSQSECTALLAIPAISDDNRRFLDHLQTADERKRLESIARAAGGTVRTKFDRAREILDWAAGAGNPNHSGDSPHLPTQKQGRFWNQLLADFKLTVVRGASIVIPPSPGADASLVEKLRSGAMPRGRPRLDVLGSEFRFLEQWIADGCPDDPL